MTQDQLTEILASHKKWLNDQEGGERANLADANLARAYLADANLAGADLARADLAGADLARADLAGADLARAYLDPIRDDFFNILDLTKPEVPGLYKALLDGKINGSTYSGECACLVGTIAKIRKVDYKHIQGIAHDPSRPAERFFLAIRTGDTPANNAVSAVVEGWVMEFAKKHSISLPERKVVWSDEVGA